MKKIFGAFLFVGLCVSISRAEGPGQKVYQVATSSITTNIISVSTSSITGATQVDSPQLANRLTVEVQDIDATANLWCVANSTAPTVNGGRKITSGNAWVLSLSNSVSKIYCLSDGAAATKAAVTQLY